ncbi:enterochelin esterase-like enzyme [Parabacteroides sp. PFB2-12]|uniref:esterase n=1 Tax=unclassified Parabacteroides TaxID=2649774 RepID=UPI00247486BA|nr:MULTISPECIES: esterase [unclassified Parabacteroides]MDH6343118.1 enterochelin esterase-like enzyme [Parabacteroides sp. PM6-13]MDH6390762.1 enterochelin esterase-like enzyme [Parabacteroides sp. PFB2-12]
MKKTLILSVVFCLFMVGCGQKEANDGRPRRLSIISPEVHADHTVTFRYLAPDAKEVKVDPQFMEGMASMEKDENGVWSVTLGPIEPDMYPYGFVVDGVTVMDNNNPFYFENERFKGSIVDIEGDSPLVHAIKDVPHGTVNYDYYPSDVLGTTGRILVYTPPGYDENPDQDYPVFYLISGTTDTDETYFKVGRANFIFDNLIAQGLAKPMIVVMPYGNPAAYFDAGDPRGMEAGRRLNDDFLQVMMPYVEKNYRTINNADNRAIGGFSRGGNQGLTLGMNNLDKFSYLCSYASFAGNVAEFENLFKHFIQHPAQTNQRINLFWLGVGTDDFLYDNAKLFMDKLEKNGIETTTMITGGGHTWMNAKLYLAESAKLLFQHKK